MARICDLHAHSYHSDGSLSPAQLLQMGQEAGLSALALCDHNTVAGLPEFMDAAKNSCVEAVPGVELSTEYEGAELHILALFVRPEHYDVITQLMEDFRRRKEQSNIALVEALCKAGMKLDYGKIKQGTKDGFVNRVHVAMEMIEKGYTSSVQEAFKTYLKPGGGYYTPPQRLDAFEAIRFIKSLGAVAVLAHPFLNLNEQELRKFLPKAVQSGLDAMETMYAKYDAGTTALAGALAQEYGLLCSGGSDFHGDCKPDIRLGTGRGELRIPYGFLEKLKQRKKDR